MSVIVVADLPQSVVDAFDAETLQILVDGLNARAVRVAPCLATPEPDVLAEAKMVLLGAFTRWSKAGAGAVSQQGAGPFQMTVDTRQGASGYNLWPSEIEGLQSLCGVDPGKAFEVDTIPASALAGYRWTSTDTWVPLP